MSFLSLDHTVHCESKSLLNTFSQFTGLASGQGPLMGRCFRSIGMVGSNPGRCSQSTGTVHQRLVGPLVWSTQGRWSGSTGKVHPSAATRPHAADCGSASESRTPLGGETRRHRALSLLTLLPTSDMSEFEL